MLKQFVKNKNRQKIGLFVALKKDNKVLIGWSKCHMRLDKFDRKLGVSIAFDRALLAEKKCFVLPHSMINNYLDFEDRVIRYFKDCTLVRSIMLPEGPPLCLLDRLLEETGMF